MAAVITTAPAIEVARRGMVVVHEKRQRDYVIGQPLREYDTYEIGVVTSITREGIVKRWRNGWGSEVDGPAGRFFKGRLLLVPNVDATAAMDVARAHHYPGHPTQPQPFASLTEVREALRPLVGTR